MAQAGWAKGKTKAKAPAKPSYDVDHYRAQFDKNVERRLEATPVRMALVGKENTCKTGLALSMARTDEEIKAGKVEYRVDKAGVIHAPIGKTSFDKEKLIDNANALAASILKAKPVAAKGKYVKGVHLSSTMGPGIRIDTVSVEAGAKG